MSQNILINSVFYDGELAEVLFKPDNDDIVLNFDEITLPFLFEPNLSSLKSEIQTLIQEPINYWLPYINIESIDVVTNEDDPTLIHNIKITINYSVDNFELNTITIVSDDSSVRIE